MPLPPIDPKTGERQTLDEIREWYRGMVEGIVDRRAAVLHAILVGAPVAPRFMGRSPAEVDAYFDAQREELGRLTILNFVASTEASIKDDFFHRIRRQLKDPLSRAYRKWYSRLPAAKRRRPDLNEGGILDVLRSTNAIDNHLVGRYRECLRPRHWVGHGRNWDTPAEIERLDPDDVYDRCVTLLRAIP